MDNLFLYFMFIPTILYNTFHTPVVTQIFQTPKVGVDVKQHYICFCPYLTLLSKERSQRARDWRSAFTHQFSISLYVNFQSSRPSRQSYDFFLTSGAPPSGADFKKILQQYYTFSPIYVDLFINQIFGTSDDHICGVMLTAKVIIAIWYHSVSFSFNIGQIFILHMLLLH